MIGIQMRQICKDSRKAQGEKTRYFDCEEKKSWREKRRGRRKREKVLFWNRFCRKVHWHHRLFEYTKKKWSLSDRFMFQGFLPPNFSIDADWFAIFRFKLCEWLMVLQVVSMWMIFRLVWTKYFSTFLILSFSWTGHFSTCKKVC